ncbi:hypothetical protein MNV49_004558 [Pseudohyphozyma bogoriensis]|nr:hypothetical protein MNV49_004558 [Pseudohyphozyma bogoriensis]
MVAKSLFTAAAVLAAAGTAAATPVRRDETHTVTLNNNCGSGNAVFLYAGDATAQGSTTITGPLDGGVAWVDGYAGADCLASGVNCGIVEFTLTNSEGAGDQNSADYSLLTGDGLGNHQYTYPMTFSFDGCSGAPGQCTGDSAAACPGAYLGSATTGGAPTQCLADNVGITITFC